MNNQLTYEKAKALIPGGTQLLSKRPEMFAPDAWPSYYSKAEGAFVWDLENNRYLDMSTMSVGACILGYADSDVDDAVISAIRSGINSSLNTLEEVELADLLVSLHPWFGGVRFCRSGGEAMSIAVRIARAHTKKDIVFFSGYHGWCDWYLAANLASTDALDGQLMPGLEPAGVPRGLQGTAYPFDVTNLEALREQMQRHEGSVAAVVIEPARGVAVSPQQLDQLRALCDEFGVLLVYDEITSGFRLCAGCMHIEHKVKPDIAVLAKSLANGYPMAAVLGRKEVMDAAQSTFISSTNWTDRAGPTAALATIRKYQKNEVHRHIAKLGEAVKHVWLTEAKEAGIEISVSGISSLPSFAFADDYSAHMDALYVQLMLSRKVLGFKQFKPSFAHSEIHVDLYHEAVREVFMEIKRYDSDKLMKIRPAQRGFHRLTS